MYSATRDSLHHPGPSLIQPVGGCYSDLNGLQFSWFLMHGSSSQVTLCAVSLRSPFPTFLGFCIYLDTPEAKRVNAQRWYLGN